MIFSYVVAVLCVYRSSDDQEPALNAGKRPEQADR